MPLIEDLANPDRPPIARRTALVVAHPDDEALMLGGQMDRFADLLVVHVTDGAPADPADARAAGFDGADAYRAARAAELDAALTLAGVPATNRVALGLQDQTAVRHVAETALRLAGLVEARRIEAVVTHAYEGGHPDHDATALSVALAARIAGAAARPIEVLEVPLYRAGPDGVMLVRSPVEGGGAPATEIRLAAAARSAKDRLIACHRSQARVTALLAGDTEVVRPLDRSVFRAAPNGGRFLYDQWGLGLTGRDFLTLAAPALDRLADGPEDGLEDGP
ncbi:PIG-L deacetylase family protein [Chthonobacter rhizosphaerae]|uniref:PIG-L deacetylase family protein n=1 Tax=Chthonobacter rhizosphaerae TaxID=2735553 RepID=UPI0015EFA821|nr:PIG-L family deacetylase [Chthonobacter rhizosphaerae]